ncbi:MAG: OmpA family protein [Bacteroidaceae bacterium]|nr:OmpA family protein [Bacteroidaceae bacterium]
MNIKKVLFTAALALGIMSASAQEQQTIEVFNPHWYIQLQGGAQYTLGERDFSDLISPNAQVTVGYNFNPIIGARLSVNAWQSKAGSTIENIEYAWKWKYVAPSVDVTVNLSNLVCGYKANRIFNLGIFAGLGANIAFDNDEAVNVNNRLNALYPGYVRPSADQWLRYIWDGTKVRLNGRAGLTADFRVSDRVAVGLEAQANIVSDHYNSKKAPNSDFYFNALAGVKIALGATHKSQVVEPCPRIVEKIVEVPKIVEKIVEVPAPVSNQVAQVEPLKETFFYAIRLSDPTANATIDKIVEWCNKYPTKGISISGYADKGTGNPKINQGYAKQRADKVAKILQQRGVAASRMTVNSYGDTVQPFPENDKNRCVIVVGE